jgi:hypothetical protein
MYMRTGSVVRPNSESSVETAASAASSTSSAGAVGRGVGHEQRFGVGGLVVDLDPHVADHADDAFDLLGVEHVVRKVIVDLGEREEARAPCRARSASSGGACAPSTSAGVSTRGAISACRPFLPFLLAASAARLPAIFAAISPAVVGLCAGATGLAAARLGRGACRAAPGLPAMRLGGLP